MHWAFVHEKRQADTSEVKQKRCYDFLYIRPTGEHSRFNAVLTIFDASVGEIHADADALNLNTNVQSPRNFAHEA